jgi:hypothetical protein
MRYILSLVMGAALLAGALVSISFGQTASEDPSQLGSRQLEVRTLDVPFDTAYRAATQAFLSIGYSISFSDKLSGILTGARTIGVTEMREEIKKAKEEAKQHQEQVQKEETTRTVIGLVPYIGWLAYFFPGSKPPAEREIKEPSRFQITMLIQEMGKQHTQIRFKMQKDGEPVWDQTVIDRLWVTTQREAMIESGPPVEKPAVSNPPAKNADESKPK